MIGQTPLSSALNHSALSRTLSVISTFPSSFKSYQLVGLAAVPYSIFAGLRVHERASGVDEARRRQQKMEERRKVGEVRAVER
jgi:hypothetical protein